jgi:type IV pilus assembly protein PilM
MRFDMSETIGLDIGSHAVKLVGFKMASNGPFLTRVGIKEIPYGNEEEDSGLLPEVIKALYREVGLNPGKVRLTVSAPAINVRRITLPAMPKDELQEAARWELKEQLSFPVESARIDCHVLKEWTEGDLKKIDLITVACPKQQIEQILTVAAKADLQPTHLEVTAFALWNALLHFHAPAHEEELALIDLGASKTGIHIFQKGVLQFSREITPGGADISRAIQEGLDPAEAPHLLFSRAERIKHVIGIPVKGPYEKIEGESISVAKISFLIRPLLEKLVNEIIRSLDYYKSHFPVERVNRILLSGGSANLKNMAAYLSGELGLPVECFRPLKGISFDSGQINPRLVGEMGPVFTAAAGVALPQSQGIELLPPKEPLWAKIRKGENIAVLSALIIGLILGAVVWSMNSQLTLLQKEYRSTMAQMRDLEMLPAKMASLKEKEMQMKQDLSFFSSTMILPGLFREILQELRSLVPGNVALTLLAVQPKAQPSREESPDKEGKVLQITGLAFGSDAQCLTALAQFIERLEKSSRFKNARLVLADQNKLYSRSGAQFEIVCGIELPDKKGKGRP